MPASSAWSRRLAAVIVALTVGLATGCSLARAAGPVTLIRIYDSDARGTVYEVCRGKFEPPQGDPPNPAYCHGRPEYWSQQRWKSYVRSGAEEEGEAGRGEEHTRTAAEPARSKVPKAQKGRTKPGVAVGPSPPAAAQATVPYGGSLDPTGVLGITNPLCGDRGELSAAQLRNCRSSRSPESAYPVGNYGWDIHISEGGFITSLFAPAVSFVLQLFSVFFWLVPLLALKGCLIILGFCFSLSPFTDNHILAQTSTGLANFYAKFTEPWLTTLIVILGGWALFDGIVRRRGGATIGGMLVALAMMLAAMWIIHAPGESVGRLAGIVNKASLVAVSAPSSGRTSAPLRNYNDEMTAVWDELTAVPFCALDFSDVGWCLNARPSKQALGAAKDGLSPEEPFGHELMADLPEGEAAATRVLNRRVAAVFGGAGSIHDLYLRFSPGSGPRDALWDYYNGTEDEHIGLPFDVGPQIDIGGGTEGAAPEKVAMQGRSGLLPRMVLAPVFVLGLIGGILLLLWLSLKLVMAAASSFVLVLLAPLGMFMPAFGAAGRSAFLRWLTSLLGAIVAKLIFSALLGVVLLGSRVLGAGIGGSSPTLGLIATMAFWWATFLNREHYLGLLQIEPVRHHHAGLEEAAAGGYVGYRIARGAKNAITRRRAARQATASQHRESQVRAGREAGERELAEQAGRRLDVAAGRAEGREAQRVEAERAARRLREDPEVRALREDPSRLGPEAGERAEAKRGQLRRIEATLQEGRAESIADRQLLRRVRANEAAGLPRHGRAELDAGKEAIRAEAGLAADAPQHRWRAEAVGKDPDTEAGKAAIVESLGRTRAAIDAGSSSRLEQIDLHRPRRVAGRRPPPDPGPSGGGSRARQGSGAPRAKRRSRARDWLSR